MHPPYPLDDRDALKEFITRTHKLLDQIVRQGGPDGGPSFVPLELQTLLKDAWTSAGPGLLDLHKKIDDASDDVLSVHGLSGPSLRFKLGVIDRVWDHFVGDKIIRWLRKLLNAIDTLLDSIIDALGPAGSAAKELKQAFEDLLEDLED